MILAVIVILALFIWAESRWPRQTGAVIDYGLIFGIIIFWIPPIIIFTAALILG